ncbi:hypothetical protein CCACVL1_20020 [Corchorus capsularis]|uniref:Uncharacterized protein n=1 Tax=Corchorus capsularis TaxID=210143 RepID=A0A1R3HD11_COCAP|nr:hypothetical protein CCACVL1_20020 [Corchorus capsularis]
MAAFLNNKRRHSGGVLLIQMPWLYIFSGVGYEKTQG